LAVTIGLLLLARGASPAHADAPTCVLQVAGAVTGKVNDLLDAPGGKLVVAANGLFRYSDERIFPVEGESAGFTAKVQLTPSELVFASYRSLYRYDGKTVARIWDPPSTSLLSDLSVQNTRAGPLLITENRLYRYDGSRVVRVEGDLKGRANAVYDEPNDTLIAADDGLFRYDGSGTTRVEGGPRVPLSEFQNTPSGLLVVRKDGDFFIFNPPQPIRAIVRAPIIPPYTFFVTARALLIAGKNGLFEFDGDKISPVAGDLAGPVESFYATPVGILLAGSDNLFIFSGGRTSRVQGQQTGRILSFHSSPDGTLLAADKGLFLYDGARIVSVAAGPTGYISNFFDSPRGSLVDAQNGLFRYKNAQVIRVLGDAVSDVNEARGALGATGDVNEARDVSGTSLLAAMKGVFEYDGNRTIRLVGEPTGPAYAFYEVNGELLFAAENGLFRAILRPLSQSKVVLDNAVALSGAVPTQLGVPTRWRMVHPCAGVADRLGLQVDATQDGGKATSRVPAIGFQYHGGATSFQAAVPIPSDGEWTFRVTSVASGTDTQVGQPSDPVQFVSPVVPGLWGWLSAWWRVLLGSSFALLIALNLAIVVASRYSATAWRLATDESWKKAALVPQRLALKFSRTAQLWLLDLYVQGQRRALEGRIRPFLSLPLSGPEGAVEDAEVVLAHLARTRHLWIQGGAGMGKTAIFFRMRETHFGGTAINAFSVFRRHGYVLIPVEARRFSLVSADDKLGSAWVATCVASVLSESGLAIKDRGLLQAMFSKGTLAIAIDGLNEVGRGQAVAAFAAEFPSTPVLITSQESGEFPFMVWHLPRTVSEHVDGLLAIYLGAQRGEALASRVRALGLLPHLRSGYDVRLVIDLAAADPEGTNLPCDRIALYRAAVAAGWPEGDNRLELLQAAAWKLLSERGPNEDKRRLKPDEDAPRDLLEELEAVRERSGRSIRLIRAAPPAYEFVHDQMNAYLAACWLTDRSTVTVMSDILRETKLWEDGVETQRVLWSFAAAMLDRQHLEILWIFSGDDDRRAVLGRALAERAERERWSLTRPSTSAVAEVA
jgi:hypothetical protein